jgi:hypothetical protein
MIYPFQNKIGLAGRKRSWNPLRPVPCFRKQFVPLDSNRMESGAQDQYLRRAYSLHYHGGVRW